jgi:hypothetical protein
VGNHFFDGLSAQAFNLFSVIVIVVLLSVWQLSPVQPTDWSYSSQSLLWTLSYQNYSFDIPSNTPSVLNSVMLHRR